MTIEFLDVMKIEKNTASGRWYGWARFRRLDDQGNQVEEFSVDFKFQEPPTVAEIETLALAHVNAANAPAELPEG